MNPSPDLTDHQRFVPRRGSWLWVAWAVLLAAVGITTIRVITLAAPPEPDRAWTNITPSNISDDPNNPHDNYGFNTIVVHPRKPAVLYMGTNYQGLWKSTDAGRSWHKANTGRGGELLDSGRQWTLAIDPFHPDTLWTTAGYGEGGPLRSRDAGVSWVKLDVGPPTEHEDVYSIAVDPYTPDHILLAWHSNWTNGDSGVSESLDGGRTWTNHEPPSGSGWGAGNAVFFMDNSETWLLGSQNSGIWRTTDSGGSWTRVDDRPIGHGATFAMTRYDDTYYVAVVTGVITSDDGGETWTDISAGLPPSNAPANVASDGTYLYTSPSFPFLTGFRDGFSWYRRPVSGGTWTPMTSEPNVCNDTPTGTICNGPVMSAYVESNDVVYAVNWTGGLWKLDARREG